MSILNRSFMSVAQASKYTGLGRRAMYDLIDKKQIPVVGEIVGGKRRYKIPSQDLLSWLAKEAGKLNVKFTRLQKSHHQLQEYLRHG